jgi:hypothetical protein
MSVRRGVNANAKGLRAEREGVSVSPLQPNECLEEAAAGSVFGLKQLYQGDGHRSVHE